MDLLLILTSSALAKQEIGKQHTIRKALKYLLDRGNLPRLEPL